MKVLTRVFALALILGAISPLANAANITFKLNHPVYNGSEHALWFFPIGFPSACNRQDEETVICKTSDIGTLGSGGMIYVVTDQGAIPVGLLKTYIPNTVDPKNNFSIDPVDSGPTYASNFELSAHQWNGGDQIVNVTVSQKS